MVTLKVVPDKTTLKKTRQVQPIKVMAAYTDGSKRDVTAQSVFMSSNSAVLSVMDKGVVSATRWGGGAILARYLGTIASSFFTLPQSRKEPYPTVATNNIIDKLVVDNLHRLNIVPSPLCTDSEFVRRVTLDTVGRLPNPDETRAFVSDTDPQKRSKMIDVMLAKPEFADFRTLRLSDLLRVNPNKLGQGLGDRAATLYYEWIWNSVDSNKPWDQFVREIITRSRQHLPERAQPTFTA